MNDRRASFLLAAILAGLLPSAALAADPVPCTPVPFDETPTIHSCVERTREGQLSLTKEALATLTFDANGLAAVSVDGVLYHANQEGRTAPALPFDNGADYLVEGLTRVRRHGRIGFADSDLREVIEARWDFAFPFEGGVAAVCLGCRGVKDGEHVAVVGGSWGYIDKQGRTIVPVRHTRDTLPPVEKAQQASRGSE